MVESQSLLITGPPACGKSRITIEHFLAAPDALLLTPTATMAEHIRNQLARSGLPVRPSRVITLAQFIDLASEGAGDPGAASRAALDTLISDALERLQIPRFQAVAQYRGFRHALAALIEEADGDALPADVARISVEVEKALASRNLALRNQRLRAADRNSSVPYRH